MAKTEIRHARREDMRAIEELFRSSYPARGWERAAQYFEEFFGTSGRSHDDTVLVAVSDDRVAGVIGLGPDWCESNDIFWLGWFCVQNDERAEHHQERLLDRIIREARRRGGRKLYAHVSARQAIEGAHRVCAQLGFKPEARLKSYYQPGEDEIVYGLNLG